jgi:hypothetical protein
MNNNPVDRSKLVWPPPCIRVLTHLTVTHTHNRKNTIHIYHKNKIHHVRYHICYSHYRRISHAVHMDKDNNGGHVTPPASQWWSPERGGWPAWGQRGYWPTKGVNALSLGVTNHAKVSTDEAVW